MEQKVQGSILKKKFNNFCFKELIKGHHLWAWIDSGVRESHDARWRVKRWWQELLGLPRGQRHRWPSIKGGVSDGAA